MIDGTIRAAAANANTRLALKNCAPFTKCNLEINDEHVDTAENLDMTMPMYNLIEYSDNYQDSSATLYQYKRDEPPEANAINDLTTDTSSSFKYKVSLLGNPVLVGNITKRSVKVVVPLKYLSNFFRSLEVPLINCKIKVNLTWKKEFVLSNQDGAAVFIINDTKLYVPVVTLSKEDNKDFIEQQNKGFQRSIYWNEYKTKEINENANANVFKYINLDPSFYGVNRLFVMAYNRENVQPTRNGPRKYYLPRIDLEKYNVIIDGRNFYDNPIESDIEKYRELKKVMIGKGEDYTTGSLLDFNYFDKHYKLVAVDLSKQKGLDADPRTIQQFEFKYILGTDSTIYWVLEKSRETILEFCTFLTNVQLNKIKKAVKSNEGATLRLGIRNFNKNETPHELLLTTRQNTKLRNALNNNSATDIKLSKAQIKKIIQSGGFLGKLLSKLVGPLMKVALPLAKNVLALLGLTAAMSAIDGSIKKKIHVSGVKLIIEQGDMNDIMKIIKALENSGVLLKGVSKTIKNETKEQRKGFLSMLLGTLGDSLLGNLLTGGKGIVWAGEGSVASRTKGDGIVRAGEGSKKTPKFTVTFSSINKYRNK